MFAGRAFGDAAMYRGSSNIGSVQTVETSSGIFVPVEDTGRLLGFTPSRSGEEVVLTRGNIQLRVMANSAAAWRGISIVPLYSAPFAQGGKLWIDSQSAAALFQPSAGTGASNKLRFNKISGYSAANVMARSEIEFGKFEEEPKAAPQPVPAVMLPKVQTVQQTQTPQPVATKTSTKSQPRLQTFKPGDNQRPGSGNYSGIIRDIRWTLQEGTHKRIRAVIEADDNAEPQVYMSGGSLHALFASGNTGGLISPYANIKTNIKQSDKGIELVFTPSGMTRAEKLVLNSPRRIVLDFFFSSSTNLTVSQPATPSITNTPAPSSNNTPSAQTPAHSNNNSHSAQIPSHSTNNTPSARTPSPSSNKAPVITNTPPAKQPRSPAVTTPPSTITIPTTPAGTGRRTGRKTIVVDPGHGGKDPGAAANGVTEKNVNLAIGLELEKVLRAQGYNVIMTRRTDVYLKLQERTDIANNANADLFVSVHVNALPSKKSMTGFEIYIMALPTDKDAMNLAKIENREYVEGKGFDVENVDRRTEMLLRILGDMQQNNKISESTDFAASLYNAGARNGLPMRRVAQAPFFVLRGAGMPAVLLETGFVTNASEARLLTTQNYQQKIAQAMASGIMNYLK